jgi:sugar lactone lactonase YvrE
MTVRTITRLDTVITPAAGLAEGPVWDWMTQKLLWVDIDRMDVNVTDVGDGATSKYHFGIRVGSVFLAEGTRVVATADGLHTLDLVTGESLRVCPLPPTAGSTRMNDGEVDPAGRVWVGTLSSDTQRVDGSLYRFDPDGNVETVLTPVTASNGLAWSPDNLLMYYVDSGAQRVDVFDYERSEGTISNQREVAAISPDLGLPDGIAVDSEGCVWVAIWGSGTVRRFTPEGALDTVVELPTPNVSSCCFGGPAFDTLYMTTSTRHLADPDPVVDGAIYACRPEVVGIPARLARLPVFAGQDGS